VAVLIHPKRWLDQPPLGAQINFGHPLANGLILYYLPTGGAGLPALMYPRVLLPTENIPGNRPSPLWTSDQGGRSINWPGSYGHYYTRQIFMEPTWVTVVARVKEHSAGQLNPFATLMRKAINDGGSAPFASYDIQYNWNNVASSVAADTNDGSNNLKTVTTTIADALRRQVHTIGLTVGPSGSNGVLQLWYNGRSQASLSYASTHIGYDTSTTTGNLLSVGSTHAGTEANAFKGRVYYGAIWNRPLTASEMEWLAVEPYAFLLPQKPKSKVFLPLLPAQLPKGGYSTFPRRYPSYQPQPSSAIDSGHPLTKGLTFLSVFNAGAGLQKALLPLNLPSTSVGSVPSPNWSATPGGKSHNWNGAWSSWYERGLWVEPPTALSLVFRARRTGTVANNATPVNKTFSNNVSPFLSYTIDYNDGGVGQDTVVAYIQTGGVLHGGAQFNLGAGATLNAHTLAMSYISGSLKLYFNGQLVQTTTTITGTPSYDQTSTGRLIISGVSAVAAAQEWIGQLYYAGIWNRVLTDAEMRLAHNEPYAMLTPKARRKYFIPLAPASNVPNQGAPNVLTKRWTQQPPQGAKINFGHPLAKGLTFYSLFNAGAGQQKALLPEGLPGNANGTQPASYWASGGLGKGQQYLSLIHI